MQIIAVTGTNGGGKGSFVNFLQLLGYKHYSARELILNEAKKRGLGDDRNVTNIVGNSLRKENCPEYVIKKLYEKAIEEGGKAVIESVRCKKEADFLKNKNVYIVSVDDPVEVRYKRIAKRKTSTDFVTLEEFIEQENRESGGIDDWDMNIPECMKYADHTFYDNGDLENFKIKVTKWIEETKLN